MQGRGDMVDDGPQHVVAAGGGGDTAAEIIELGGTPGRLPAGLGLLAAARRHPPGQHRHHQEEGEGKEILGAGDDEFETRLGEEIAIDDEAQQPCDDRRP